MTGCIAVINAGSSSIKFALYEAGDSSLILFRGQMEQIGVSPRLHIRNADGDSVADRYLPGMDHRGATQEILKTLVTLIHGARVLGVGHRVVHGGMHYAAPVRIDGKVIAELSTLSPLAPLHQPHNLAPIVTIAEAAPHISQVACFDTAFHRNQPHLAQLFALPRKYTDEGVRRYGFHGLSYEYVTSRLKDVAPDIAAKRVVIAHLGNGASLCAIHEGRSFATTMGFTAVDGLMMGTRCGAIDPGVLVYLMDTKGLDARGIENLIYRESGLLGVSGISSDMRALLASEDPRAQLAIDLYVYRIRREMGSLAAALGGLDAIVFTAGIGEHARAIRERVCRDAAWLGVELDGAANDKGGPRISASSSRVSVWTISTNEELMIARHTRALLGAG